METKLSFWKSLIANSANLLPSSGKFGGLWMLALGSIIALLGVYYGMFMFKEAIVFQGIINLALLIMGYGTALIGGKIIKPSKNTQNNDVN